MALNNNQIYLTMREALVQAVGKEAIENVGNLSDIVDIGKDGGSVSYADIKDQLTGALIGVLTKNWFTQSEYRSQYNDPFYKDSAEYGAIVQAITIAPPEVQHSSAWETMTSGVTTGGTFTVMLPTISTRYYTKSDSWELPITISYEQWDTAFDSEQGVNELVSYIFMVVDNALVTHLENMNNINRNNFLLERQYNGGGVGVHNICKMYYDETKDANVVESGTVKRDLCFLQPKFWLYFSEKMRLFKSYMSKMNTMFVTGDTPRFTPESRLVVQVLSDVEQKFLTYAMSDTYHNDIVNMPKHETIPYFQGFGNGATFDEVSKIDGTIEISGTPTEKTLTGVCAIMLDEWAIMHTIRKQRVGFMRDDIKNLGHYAYQFRDSYYNNLEMPACIFVANDSAV